MVFVTTSKTDTSTLRTACAWIFWDSGLHNKSLFAAHAGREPWFKSRLKEYFESTPYGGLFSPPWMCTMAKKNYVWKPNKSNCPSYVDAINTCIWLTENASDENIVKLLFRYLDSQMCNIYQINNFGTCDFIDDTESHVLNYYIPKVIMDVLPPAKPQKDKDKILHTLSKALPLRNHFIKNAFELI